MAITVSPNMSLIIPGVGTEAGPTYASDINSSLSLIDQHDHSVGSGVQITPAGININADLSMAGNNLTLARTLRLQPQLTDPAGPSDLGILYEVGVDLYYKDGAGNAIRITQSGSVAGSTGTITGLPSGTASAAFSAGTFVFQAATLTGANIDGASYILRNNVASSKALTLQPPNAMAVDYSLTLPALPVSQKIVTLDTSGNLVADYDVDNSSIEVSSDLIQVKDRGITYPKRAVRSLVASPGTVVGEAVRSASTGAYTVASSSYSQAALLTIECQGGVVRIELTTDISGSDATVAGSGAMRIVRDGLTSIGAAQFNSTSGIALPSFVVFDQPGAGSHTYALQAKANTPTVFISNCTIVAYEI